MPFPFGRLRLCDDSPQHANQSLPYQAHEVPVEYLLISVYIQWQGGLDAHVNEQSTKQNEEQNQLDNGRERTSASRSGVKLGLGV